jgi:flagellar basal body-associated protein FliL
MRSSIIISLAILVLGVTVLIVLVWLSHQSNQSANITDKPNIFNTTNPIVKNEGSKATNSVAPDPFKEFLNSKQGR